jgi:uridine kinase
MGKNEPTLDPVTVTISGRHDSGRTTLANLIKMTLEENEYRHVTLQDVKPISADEKDRFSERFERNRYLRPVNIHVVTEEV